MTMTCPIAVIIDPGSDTLKAGFSGDDVPRYVIPSVVGEEQEEQLSYTDTGAKKFYFGDEVVEGHCVLKMTSAVTNGLVTSWPTMERLLRHTYQDGLKVNPKDFPALVTEAVITNRYSRERMAQLMFETFEVPALYLKDTATLSLFNSGRISGTVVESGDAVTTTCVVNDGQVLRDTIPKTFYAGRDVTYHLIQMLKKRGCAFSKMDKLNIRGLKERFAFVSDDFERDLILAREWNAYEEHYELPNGEMLYVNDERFLCCESIFKPEMFGCCSPGIHYQVKKTVELADDHHIPFLDTFSYSNIVLAGGNTIFPNFGIRLKMELDKLIPSQHSVIVVDSPDRRFAAWIGGSVMASIETMENRWVTKQQYEEEGPNIIRKCLYG